MKFLAAAAQVLAVGVLTALGGSVSAQQPYPSKPIRIVVPFPPGGSADPMARMVAPKLAEKWGQSVIVDNRPGGNSIIGTDAVAKASPDGYTLLLVGSAPHVTTPSLLTTPYDAIKDFDAVATIAKSVYVLVLHPSVPANNLQEFIALAKSKPGQLNYSSSGAGSAFHLTAVLFGNMTGVKMQHIPYKGSGPAVTDLIGGQVQLAFQGIISVISHIKSGKLKPIAVISGTRSSALPQVPTFTEAGLPGFEMSGWLGIVAPTGTPKAVIDKLSREMAVILVMPDIQEYLAKQGLEPYVSTPEQFSALMKADFAKYAKIIKDANVKM